MSKTPPDYLADKEFQQFLQQMEIIAITESGGQTNPEQRRDSKGNLLGSARGKYQYVWSQHKDNIRALARRLGKGEVTEDEFANDLKLQTEYFVQDQYENFQIAKKNLDGNKFGYNTAQIGALIHFQGRNGAEKILRSGKHKGKELAKDGKTLLNPGTKEYIDQFTNNLASSGKYVSPQMEKNMLRPKEIKDNRKRHEITDKYDEELAQINEMPVDALQKNVMIQDLNDRFFQNGNLELVNQVIRYRNKHKAERLEDLRAKNNTYNIDASGKRTTPKITAREAKELASLEKESAAIEARMRADEQKRLKGVPVEKRRQLLHDGKSTIGAQEWRKLYGWGFKDSPEIDLSQYDKRYEQRNPEPEPAPITDTDGSGGGSTGSEGTSNTPAPVEVKTALTDEEYMQALSPGMFIDEQFEYHPGNFQLPFEAIGYGMMALQGMKMANTKVPMRTEQVSEGFLDYGAQLAKVAQMGLDPETEAKLKDDLREVYQTSLTNITRASNGNRNLILGNQGQADMARVQGLSNIALMDVERRDKAMQALGNVQKYISDFDASRDIANNDRQYREVEKKQMAGTALAQQGFSALMSSLQYAKENAPGSSNDMMRQYLMWSISGVNPGIKDDGSGTQVGTASYAKAQTEQIKAQNDQRKQIRDIASSLDREGNEKLKQFWFENPNMRPDHNKNLKADEFRAAWEKYNGLPQAKSEVAAAQGVQDEGTIMLTDQQVNDDSYMTEGKPTFPPRTTNYEDPADAPAFNPIGLNGPATNGGITGNAVPQESLAVMNRLASLNAQAEKMLGESAAQNLKLDTMIGTTESQTKQMENQLNGTY